MRKVMIVSAILACVIMACGANLAQAAWTDKPNSDGVCVHKGCPKCEKCQPCEAKNGVMYCPNPCKECPDCVCKPVVNPLVEYRYVDVPTVERPRGQWYAAGSGGYVDGAMAGIGGGYKFGNGVALLAQGLYQWRHGGWGGYDVSGEACAPSDAKCRCYPYTVNVPGVKEENAWGGVVTVMVPIGRR